MKTLLLVRHAKSSWNDSSLPDFERPLNERGRHDAPEMAKRIKNKSIDIDLFVSSPAKRAKKTAELFMEKLGANKKNLVLIDELYEASVDNFYDVIAGMKDKHDVIALFSHNPGMTNFIDSLQLTPVTEMPTCGIYAITIVTNTWADFKNSKKKFLFFDYPKKDE